MGWFKRIFCNHFYLVDSKPQIVEAGADKRAWIKCDKCKERFFVSIFSEKYNKAVKNNNKIGKYFE